jgi:hypothetical protein
LFNIYDHGRLIHSRPTSTVEMVPHLFKVQEPKAPEQPMTAQQLSTHHSEYLQKFLRGY